MLSDGTDWNYRPRWRACGQRQGQLDFEKKKELSERNQGSFLSGLGRFFQVSSATHILGALRREDHEEKRYHSKFSNSSEDITKGCSRCPTRIAQDMCNIQANKTVEWKTINSKQTWLRVTFSHRLFNTNIPP